MELKISAATLFTLAALLGAATALAEPTAADRETARTLMRQGRELRDKGDAKEALKRFKAADDIMKVPTTALEVAKTEIAVGMLVEARDAFAAIRRRPAQADDPAPFKEARTAAEDLDNSLNGRIPSVTVSLKGAAADQKASFAVDGVDVASAIVGLPFSVDPGHHTVAAKTPTSSGTAEFDVKEGEQKTLEVELIAGPAPPPPEQPPPPEEPAPPVRSHSPTLLTWIGVGVAGAGLIGGGVTGYLSLSTKSNLDSECPNHVCTSSQAQSDLDSASMYSTLSTVGFAVAGAGAALAVATLIIGHDTTASPATEPTADAPPADPPGAPAADPAAAPPAPAPAPQSKLHVIPWVGVGSAGVFGTF